MLKALVWKEARELAPLVALAIVAELLFYFPTGMFFGSYSNYSNQIPFVSSSLQNWLLIVGGVTGVILGFWQTAGELLRGTFLFLLHRSVDRAAVFAAKLAVGVALTLLIVGVPILGYALWAATPGTHASPFFWSMTTATWLLWFRLPLFYLGAYLSGLRPGRWWGSRALPLAATPLLFMLLLVIDSWPAVSLGLTLLLELCYLLAIFHVAATRDYS
jgi:ABC-type transport system involved in multi-copper enzyme maturation permease subunit